MGGVSFYEEHRLACAYDVEEKLFGKLAGIQHLIVPFAVLGVEALDPDAGVLGAGTDEVHIHRVVDEPAVGPQFLNRVPEVAEHRRMHEERRGIDEYDGLRHSVQHGGHVIQHGLLALAEPGAGYGVVVAFVGEQKRSGFAEYMVSRKYAFP